MREVLSSLGWLLPTGPGAFAHIFIIFARTSYSACLFLPLAFPVLYQKEKDPTTSQPEALLKWGEVGGAELIFVTNITNYICGQKIVMWRNFGEIWGNFEKFWEILPQFTRFHVEKN